MVAIKALCRRANVARIDVGPKGAVVGFRGDSFSNPGGLIAYIAKHPEGARVRPDMRVVFFDESGKLRPSASRRHRHPTLARRHRGEGRQSGVSRWGDWPAVDRANSAPLGRNPTPLQ